MRIVLLGSPGAGKGTYAAILSKKFKIPHISTGDLLREEIKNSTEQGKQAKTCMDKGNLVPDELITEILKKKLSKAKKGFLLDGYPRNLNQAKQLEKITNIQKAFNFEATDKVIMERLGGRLTCRKCGAIYHKKNMPPKQEGICDKCGGELYTREDEKPEVIKQRLEVYRKQTKPLIGYYKKKGILSTINASYPIKEVEKIINPVSKQIGQLS